MVLRKECGAGFRMSLRVAVRRDTLVFLRDILRWCGRFIWVVGEKIEEVKMQYWTRQFG